VPIKMIHVENSSNVLAIGWGPFTGDLLIDFKGGTRYLFKKVPLSLWEKFQAAESKGAFFAREIKGKFESEKVERPKEVQIEKVVAQAQELAD
jgi:hypothetical protein